jgi:membrane protein involved in colicin uptake
VAEAKAKAEAETKAAIEKAAAEKAAAQKAAADAKVTILAKTRLCSREWKCRRKSITDSIL